MDITLLVSGVHVGLVYGLVIVLVVWAGSAVTLNLVKIGELIRKK